MIKTTEAVLGVIWQNFLENRNMAEFDLAIFAADNIINPQNPGFLPAEDNTFLSDLVVGNQITWVGGGESAQVTIIDNQDTQFSEAQSNQTLKTGITFDGTSYNAGQIVTPSYTITFNGSDNQIYVMTSFNFSPNNSNQIADAVLWEGVVPPNGTVLTVISESNPAFGGSPSFEDFVTCFCKGTYIQTPDGPLPVENLEKDDRVCIQGGGTERVHHIYRREISSIDLKKNPKLRPIKITVGALGLGLPTRDLWVSRQHRMLVNSPISSRMFGADDALVSAVKLTQLPGVYIDTHITHTEYFHILLANHEIIFAENAPTESLYLGVETLKTMTPEGRREVLAIFPELKKLGNTLTSARYIPSSKLQKKLIERHVKNRKPLIAHHSVI